MRRTRRLKHLSRWLVGVLLAAQWLVASYACPPLQALAALQGAGGYHAAALHEGMKAIVDLPAASAAPDDAADPADLPPCHRAMALAAAGTDGQAAPWMAASALPAAADASLCKAHCSAGQQLPGQVATTDTVPHAAGWCLVQQAAPALPVVCPPASWPPQHLAGAPPPGWPPLFIAHEVLRN